MTVIKIGLSSTIIKSAKAKISLENIVIKDTGVIEVWLNRNPATKEYYVTAVLTDCTYKEFITATCITKSSLPYTDKKDFMKAGHLLYQSENFKSKKEAKKEYGKILKAMKNGNYILEIDLSEFGKLEFKYNLNSDKNDSDDKEMLECKVCHAKIKKGDIYVEGNISPVCLRCDSIAMADAIHERNIASLDKVPENKKRGD